MIRWHLWVVVLVLATGCGVQVLDTDDLVGVEDNPIAPSPPFAGDPASGAVFGIDISHWEGPMSQREMDCFWDSGVRHVVSGTQVEEVTRQQLEMAVSRGMTVDAYVYLYWNLDLAAQVKEAFRRSQGFPIQRMWLDVEEDPGKLGANAIIALVQQALDACNAQGGATCGIYTGPGFWQTYMNDTSVFSQVPLWYAWYNYKKSLAVWSVEQFGGWLQPTGKQWAEQVLCSVGVDKNVMLVPQAASVLVDRSLLPDTMQPPPAPTGLFPADGAVVGVDYIKLMTATIPRASHYQLALESWDGKIAFKTYYTWTRTDPFITVYPAWHNAIYRFRARAQNGHGWGAWSAWATFDWGNYSGPRPGSAPPPPPAPPPPATPPPATPPPATPPPATPPPWSNRRPAPAGAPTGLAPDGNVLSTAGVKLSCDTIQGASLYEFSIEFLAASGSYAPYVAYQSAAPCKTFYPQVHNTTYRFRVRATVGGVPGPWSNPASFQYK